MQFSSRVQHCGAYYIVQLSILECTGENSAVLIIFTAYCKKIAMQQHCHDCPSQRMIMMMKGLVIIIIIIIIIMAVAVS